MLAFSVAFPDSGDLAPDPPAGAPQLLEQVIDEDQIWVFEVPDNLDSQFYMPALFREYCLPVLRKMARMIHARGKYLFVHACGRMTALEQEWSGPDSPTRIDRHVRDLFGSMGQKRRFLFGSGCNTSPQTSYQNLLGFRDAAWKYGKLV